MKHRNGCGAKGRREVEDGMNGRPEGELATVSGETKQARDIRVRRNWMEPEVWTDRMLTTLNKESKEQEAQIDGGSSLAECFLCGMWLLSPCAAHTFVRQSLGRANHQLESRMRETRQSGSEGGGTSVLPTPITSPGRTVPCGRLLARRGRKPWVAGVMVVRALKARPIICALPQTLGSCGIEPGIERAFSAQIILWPHTWGFTPCWYSVAPSALHKR